MNGRHSKTIASREQELQFTSFNESTAWQIGTQMVEHAMRENLPVTIDITRGQHQLFHASMPGTAADNDEWVKRKVRLVNRFGHSSFYMGQMLKHKGKTIEQSYLISESEFAAHGGCFPIIVKGTGMVGTITVSGLPQEEDHKLVVESIRAFLAKEK
ncbi:heme-degrading domain-containing protein [Candidatus Villigracilis affinis]|uniref:heme-degrading domain-containing protein n=1 Tax=Candidatus Villigracilis affinis TaxID=3140682 RepID=UPI001D9FE648|nr:heme-degrading domain-containing protein [Anaerolineales bacterium]